MDALRPWATELPVSASIPVAPTPGCNRSGTEAMAATGAIFGPTATIAEVLAAACP